MPLSIEDHLDNLLRHIELVREACTLLGTRLIRSGEKEFGRILIARGHQHDVSKFFGIEWDYLHAGRDVPKEELDLAIKQHRSTNDHHPEFWGGINNMADIALAEWVCDVYARSQEFGSSLRDWIEEVAIEKFQIDKKSRTFELINKYINILLENQFRQDHMPME